MCDRLRSSEAEATLLNGISHLGDCTNVVGIVRPVYRETEIVSNGTHEGLITREGKGIGEVIREIAQVEKGPKVDAGTHHHQEDPAVMNAGDWI